MSPHSTESSGRQVWKMFDRIAHRYDLLNRLLSFGRDIAWRKHLCRQLPSHSALQLLDLATGTADVLLAMPKYRDVSFGVGVDPSGGMLQHGWDKIKGRGEAERLRLVRGDAMALSLPDNHFDAVTIAFGIRNVADFEAGLREMHRILKPGGRAIILEFSLPPNRLFRMGYLFYFRHILPRIGGLISGDFAAYRYLNQTVESFPYGDAFRECMERAGFQSTQAHPQTLGIASVYVGEK